MSQLEKHYKKNEGKWSREEAIQVAIQTLMTVVSSDFKASDIEVGVASVDKPRFVKLADEEVEE